MLAIISGASKGIGRAMAFAFAKEGFDLALGARTFSDLEVLKHQLASSYPKIKIFIKQVDFSVKQEVSLFAREVKTQWEGVSVIINNVGTYTTGTVSNEKEGILETIINTNLYSAYYLTRPFLEGMKKAQSGHIFNICSVVKTDPRAEAASYSISKIALLGFNKVLFEEMRQYNVKVMAVLPGSVNTSSWDGMDAPKEEFIQPEDVVAAVLCAYKMSKYSVVEEIIIKPVNKKI